MKVGRDYDMLFESTHFFSSFLGLGSLEKLMLYGTLVLQRMGITFCALSPKVVSSPPWLTDFADVLDGTSDKNPFLP